MRKIYFKFLFIAFTISFLTIVVFFYFGYLKREQIRKERLRIPEIKEIYRSVLDNIPFDNSKNEILKEIEELYNVQLYLKTKNGFNYTSNKNLLSRIYSSKFFPLKRTKRVNKKIFHQFKLKRKIFPDINNTKDKITYFLDKRTKILRGIKIKTPFLELIILKNSGVSFLTPFFILIFFLFILSGGILFLIRKWYVIPLYTLEQSIKSIEENLNSPELYEDSTGTLTQIFNALNSLKKRIIHEINSKEEMLRDISHDLKTPLSRIKLAAEFIENEKIKKGIKKDIEELEALISKILSVHSYNDNEKNNCKTALSVFFKNLKTKYERVRLTVKCENEILAPICEDDLKRIFYNLIDNSLKFADISKGIYIEAEIIDKILVIKFKDCSTKGDKPDLGKIFDYFYKKDRSRNKAINDGFGLGLSIVKKICEQYRGSIIATHSDCDGLQFIIKFPLA